MAGDGTARGMLRIPEPAKNLRFPILQSASRSAPDGGDVWLDTPSYASRVLHDNSAIRYGYADAVIREKNNCSLP